MFEFVEVKYPSKAYLTQIGLAVKPFYEYIAKNFDKPLTVIFPSCCDIEDYVFMLESDIKRQYNVSITNQGFQYIPSNRFIEEVPTFLDYVIIDPRCYMEEIRILNEVIEKVRGAIDG